MPMSMMDDDYRIELLLWILIGAFWPRGYLDPNAFHSTALRYERELRKRGIEISLYPDIVTDRSRAVDNAAVRAMEYGILQPNFGSERVNIVRGVEPFLRKPKDTPPLLSDEEIIVAKESAGIAFMAFRERRLNDDKDSEAA